MSVADPPVVSSVADLNLNASVVGSETLNYSSVDAAPSRGGGVCRALYLEVTGTVKVTFADGTVDTLVNLTSGVWHPMAVTLVWHTGTTASLGIHAGY